MSSLPRPTITARSAAQYGYSLSRSWFSSSPLRLSASRRLSQSQLLSRSDPFPIPSWSSALRLCTLHAHLDFCISHEMRHSHCLCRPFSPLWLTGCFMQKSAILHKQEQLSGKELCIADAVIEMADGSRHLAIKQLHGPFHALLCRIAGEVNRRYLLLSSLVLGALRFHSPISCNSRHTNFRPNELCLAPVYHD